MSPGLSGRVALAGIGETAIGTLPGRTYLQLQAEAVLAALEDAGLRREDVDAVFTNLPIRNPTSMSAEHLIEYLRLPARVASTMDAHGAGAVLQIQHAAAMIAAGLCRVAVCVVARDDRIWRGRPRRSSLLMGTEDEADLYGAGSPPVQYALAARRHMHEYGTTNRQFGAVAVAMRRHASVNPNAQMRKAMTLDDHQSSPWVVDPFRLLDCCQVSDAAGAVVVVSAERARDLRRRPVLLRGMAEAHTHRSAAQAPGLTTLGSADAAERVYAMAGLTPGDVDFAEIYDCFTYAVIVQLEDYGFCPKGEGGGFVEGGRIELGGELPVNTHGGLLSQGHADGMFHVTEAVRQLREAAGERQVPGAEVALVTGVGGAPFGAFGSLILTKD